MASEQEQQVVPPQPYDKDLKDFTTVIQNNFLKLFEDAHIHLPLATTPSGTDGRVGDIRIVTISSTFYLYVKVASTTWKRVALS